MKPIMLIGIGLIVFGAIVRRELISGRKLHPILASFESQPLVFLEPKTTATGFNHSTSSQIIFRLVRIGTARKIPGIPQTHPQNRNAPNTMMGLRVKRLPRMIGVMKLPSNNAKQR